MAAGETSGRIERDQHRYRYQTYISMMSSRLFARRIVMMVVALGIVLSGADPSLAMIGVVGKDLMPAGMSIMMPGMAMQCDCSGMAYDRGSNTGSPCKTKDAGCALCTTCALPVGLRQDSSLFQLFARGSEIVFTQDVNRCGIAVRPALPPPILCA